MNHALILSSASTVKVITWLMTINALSGNIISIMNGTQKKPKKPEKSELTQLT